MKAQVDAAECTGCTICTETCPEVFRMEADTAFAHTDPVPAEAEESCKSAAEDCPVGAITIEE
ncbi:MAG: ferredoxin [Armatimonadota bacterium]